MPLNNTQVKNFKPKAKLYRKLDRDGLYIEVAVSGTKSWLHRYSFNNKPTMRTLGRYDDKTMPLLKAREALLDDKRFEVWEVNPGYLDMLASLSVDEMKEFHKEHDSKFARNRYNEEMKFLDDALNVYGDKTYSRFVVHIAEW